jgi:hypothetical protein
MRRLTAALLALCALALACAKGPGDRRTLRAKGPFAHPSGIELPARVALLERKLIREFDGDPGNIAAYFSSREGVEPVQFNVYLAPAGQAFAGRLKQQFAQRLAGMRRGSDRSSLLETRVMRAPGGTGRAVGYESTFQTGSGENRTRTQLRLFQCGQWFLRFEASAREKDLMLLDESIAAMHAAVSCEDIADRDPAGNTLEVSIEAGVADRADWRAYAEGQVDWLRRNVSGPRLALGIPDHELGLFVAAWNRALDSQPRPSDPLFDALARARSAGYLEEYLWTEHLPFLEPPIELDLESFRAWRSDEKLSAAYQIRAGAVLVRSAPAKQ